MNVPSGSKPSFTCPSPSASEVMRSLHMKEGPSVCGAQSTLVFYEGPHLAVHRISDLTDKQDAHTIHFCRHFNLGCSAIISQIRRKYYFFTSRIVNIQTEKNLAYAFSFFAFVCKLPRGIPINNNNKPYSQGYLSQEIRIISLSKIVSSPHHVTSVHCEKQHVLHSRHKILFFRFCCISVSLCDIVLGHMFFHAAQFFSWVI